MDIYLKIPVNMLLMASGAAMWFLTPWSVWSAAMIMAGLGVLTLGRTVSYAFIGATVLLLMLGCRCPGKMPGSSDQRKCQ